MKVTISTHNGSDVARQHNIRNPKVIEKESHIKPGGDFEIWLDVDPREKYQELFGKAVSEYNSKQKREDRKISNYYNKIKEDPKKHPVYEMIVGIYPQSGSIDEKLQRDILKEFCDGWQKRNPNLALTGVYYHNDEQGEPHVHIDYIPVARDCRRGLSVQNSLSQALEQQGIRHGGNLKATRQIMWQRSENQVLESICNRHGLDVIHPEAGKSVKHLKTQDYKKQQDINKALSCYNSLMKFFNKHKEKPSVKTVLKHFLSAYPEFKQMFTPRTPLKQGGCR